MSMLNETELIGNEITYLRPRRPSMLAIVLDTITFIAIISLAVIALIVLAN